MSKGAGEVKMSAANSMDRRQKVDREIQNLTQQKIPLSFILSMWDDIIGPQLESFYPNDPKYRIDLINIADQLFNASILLYGYSQIYHGEGILLKAVNLGKDAYLYFDFIEDTTCRANKRLFMLGVVSPTISFYDSLRLKLLLVSLADKVKNQEKWDIHRVWIQIETILHISLV
jgi:hypothetical protein